MTVLREIRCAILGVMLALAFLFWTTQGSADVPATCWPSLQAFHSLSSQGFAHVSVFEDGSHRVVSLYVHPDGRWVMLGMDASGEGLRACALAAGPRWQWALAGGW